MVPPKASTFGLLALFLASCSRREVPTAAAMPVEACSGLGGVASASASARPIAGAPPAASSVSAPVAIVPAGPAPFVIDKKTHDVAIGAFAGLAGGMVLVRRKDGGVHALPLSDKPGRLDDDGQGFARLKSLSLDHADGGAIYWNEKGKLSRVVVSAKAEVGAREALAEDAEEGYAPGGATTSDGRAVIVYVAKKRTSDGERHVRAWIEGTGLIDVSEEGSSASSVAAVRIAEAKIALVWLDGRSAIAPVHRATIDLAANPPVFGDATVFVAPPSELATELVAARLGNDAAALLATPKNGTTFGLALIPAAIASRPRDEVPWLDYPNGLDPAPVAAATFCGRSAFVFAEPTDKPPDSPRGVMLATLDDGPTAGTPVELGRAKRIDHIAAWSAKDADGWVLWVGDGRTIVRHVGCKSAKK